MKKSRQVSLARELRQKQTDAEKILWARLRNMQMNGVKFRRQQAVGNYIVDFVSFDKKLIVEIDGGQHNEMQTREKDTLRTIWLEGQGFHIMRFWDNDVLLNAEGVLTQINDSLR